MKETYPAYNNLPDLAHSPIWPCSFGQLSQQVFMQGDVGIQVAENVSELLLRHDGELQHRVMVRLWTGAKPKMSNNIQAGLLRITWQRALGVQEKDKGTIPVFL